MWSYLQGCCGCSRALLVQAGGRSDCSCAGGRCSACRLLSWVPAGGQTWSFTPIVLSRLHQMDHVMLSHSPRCLLVSCFARRASWRILRPPSEPSRHGTLYPAHWHKHNSSQLMQQESMISLPLVLRRIQKQIWKKNTTNKHQNKSYRFV